MSVLVYPPPAAGPSRWVVRGLGLAVCACLLALAVRLEAWGALGPVPVVVAAACIRRRVRTVVTAETITVRGVLRTRQVRVSAVKRLVDPGRFGDHVLVVPENDSLWPLPRTVPADTADIQALTGLPVVAGRQP